MIILTGGAGFIGSCILGRLNKEGTKDVLVVDQLDREKENNLKNKKFKDYIDKDEFIKLVKQNKFKNEVGSIIHMGACSSTTLQDKEYFRTNNYEYSLSLAKFSLANNIRFLYASSGATYGDGSFGYSDRDENTLKLKPLNLYGWSKHNFDLWVIENKVDDKVVGFKFFNVFGPNEYHKQDMMSVVAKAFEQIKNEGKIRLFKSYRKEFKDGEQKRDFIYIKDALEVVFFFLEHPDKFGIYNVGTGKAQTWNELANSVFSYFKKDPVVEYIDMPEGLKERYQYFTQADISKLFEAGYKKDFLLLQDSTKDYCSYLENKKYL